MRLRSLTFENFRQFYGTQSIRFAEDRDKNVTIVYGANGAGKTTILNAFTWCLFRSFTPAFDNPTHLINERAWDEGSPLDVVSASVRLEFEHENKVYQVVRKTARLKNRDGSSQLETDSEAQMWHTDETGRVSPPSKSPDDAIEQIMPNRLHRFFFFDGERIEQLAKSSAYEQIGEAIKTVLGLAVIERGFTHLATVGKKLEGELRDVSPPDMQKIIDELEAIDRQIEQKTNDRTNEVKKRENVADEIEAINARLRKLEEAEALQKRRDDLVAALTAGKVRLAELRAELSHKFSVDGHLAFSSGLCSIALEKLEALRQKGALPTPLKRQFVEDLLEKGVCICGCKLEKGSEAYGLVADWKNKAGSADVEEVWTELTAQARDFVRQRDEFYRDLQNRQKELVEIQQQQQSRSEDISIIDATIDTRGSEEARNLNDRRKQLQLQSETAIEAATALKIDLDALAERRRDKLKEQQDKKLEGEKANLAQRRVKVVLETQKLFQRILDLRTEEVRETLDQRLKKIYGRISFKRYTPQLTDGFRLELTKTVGSAVEQVARSSGENQLLSLAFVGSIADLARERHEQTNGKEAAFTGFQGGIYPIVMDSAFGSLDEGYQRAVAKAVPVLVPQVLILVSKSQGLGEVAPELAPRIGERYVLSYWTPKDDMNEEQIKLDGAPRSYVSKSSNDYEWAEITEVPVG